MKKMNKRESGQALILVLILLVVGGLIIAPLLAFVSSGLRAGQVYEDKTDELYAADAGVEDAIYNILYPDAPFYDSLRENGSHSYTLTQEVNSLPVNVTVTKLSLIEGLLGEDEYKLDRPHEDWCQFDIPPDQVTRNYDEGWVEYYCDITLHYDGTGQRSLVSVGTFFSPFPGDRNLIEAPYDETPTPVITLNNLESTETKTTTGGFSFIWRWLHNLGPNFDQDNRDGALSFKFKIYDANWESSVYFVWATFKEQDISYVTNAPGFYKWLIETIAGDTTVRSVVIEDIGALSILTWEINPPQ